MVKTHLLNFFALNLNNYKNLSESELLDCECFFCDFIEYSFHATDPSMVLELNNKFLEIFTNTQYEDAKQTCCYGFGVFALYIPPAMYTPVLAQVLQALNSVISASDA